jgi:uncharacterized membrane protein
MPQSIYISGTYADLKTYRKAAALTVEDFGFRAKDSYTAGPAPVVESCLADVDGCDAFLGIVGLTYGWVPPDGDKRSITHREFDRAEGKKRLIFIVDAQADLAPEVKGFRDGFGGKVRAARFSSALYFIGFYIATAVLAAGAAALARSVAGVGWLAMAASTAANVAIAANFVVWMAVTIQAARGKMTMLPLVGRLARRKIQPKTSEVPFDPPGPTEA